MSRLNLILLPSALALAMPGWAETGQKKAPVSQARPLNLSLPRDVMRQTPGSGQADETALRNLTAPAQTGNGADKSAHPVNLPYGAGYEHRHQEMGGAGGSTGSGASAGNGGGRRGR